MIRNKCTVYPNGEHIITFSTSTPNHTEYSCVCGEVITEYEDCGTGA